LAFPGWAEDYPSDTIRWEPYFVKGKSKMGLAGGKALRGKRMDWGVEKVEED